MIVISSWLCRTTFTRSLTLELMRDSSVWQLAFDGPRRRFTHTSRTRPCGHILSIKQGLLSSVFFTRLLGSRVVLHRCKKVWTQYTREFAETQLGGFAVLRSKL